MELTILSKKLKKLWDNNCYLNKNNNIHIGKAVKKVDTSTNPKDKKNEATIDEILFFLFGLKYANIENKVIINPTNKLYRPENPN